MPFCVYNTVTRQKEEFRPLEPGKVKIYVCGPTVYDYFHVGNARAFIVFDTLRRVLQHRGYEVTYVQNITDIDDKIINRAKEEGIAAEKVAEKYTQAFLEDFAALGCLPIKPEHMPKATENIKEIQELIVSLVNSGHAYVLDGDVYFSVRSFSRYGYISGKNIDELEKGARVEIDTRKKDPLDFALWKKAKPGEPSWKSSWGEGRPGWHIECSAMSMKYLGDQFDIHGGGADLIFPHHENENAQSECLTGKPLARYWMHNGYLNIRGEKMSKSLGNFRITRDVLKLVSPQVLRLFMLSAHYRSPLDFNPESLEAARQGYIELKRTLERLHEITRSTMSNDYLADKKTDLLEKENQDIMSSFEAALDDDLNTAEAIGKMYSLAGKAKQFVADRPQKTYRLISVLKSILDNLKDMTGVLGIMPDISEMPEEIYLKIQGREKARKEKRYQDADVLRDEIVKKGYLLEDTSLGTLATNPPPPHKITKIFSDKEE